MKKKWDILVSLKIRRKSFFSFKISVEIRAIFMIKTNLPIHIKTWNPSIDPKTMLGMREINDYVLLSTDVDPQAEDTEKSLDFHFISEFRFYFFTVVSYNPHVYTTNSGVCDLVLVYIFIFEEWLVVVLSGWKSNWLCCFFVWNRNKKWKVWLGKGLNSHENFFQQIWVLFFVQFRNLTPLLTTCTPSHHRFKVSTIYLRSQLTISLQDIVVTMLISTTPTLPE